MTAENIRSNDTKECYAEPKLVRFGSLNDLTRANSTNNDNDGGGGGNDRTS